jgi:type II secretory pathway component PulF
MTPLLQNILETLFWMLMAAVLLAAALVMLGWVTTPVLGLAACMLVLVLLPLLLRLSMTIRARRAAAVLGYIEQAVRLNLPLPRMLEAAERGEDAVTAYRLQQFRQRLEDGYSIGVALLAAVPEVGDRSAAFLTAGERIGQLPRAVERALAVQRAPLQEDAQSAGFLRAYPVVMFAAIMSTLTVFSIYVLPKFATIFRDFGVKLPPLTRAVMGTAREFQVVLLAATAVFLLAWAGRVLRRTLGAPETSPALRPLRDRVLWAIPISHRLVRDRGLADAFDLIHQAITQGLPADRAIAEASNLRVNTVLRRQLALWAEQVRAGLVLHEAARAVGMPHAVAELLAPLRSSEGAASVFGFLARYYATRFSRTEALARAAAVPAMVFFFAIIVALVVISLIAPLASLINSTSAYTSGVHL